MVVICGSANSWIRDKLINNHGGLYGRVTYQIKLEPFNLKENEEYLISKGLNLSRYDVIQSYMMVGGIPYYLNYFQRGKSMAQIVDDLFFAKNAKLKDEYDKLFASVFTNPEQMKKIIKVLNGRSAGYTRKEISNQTGITDGGGLGEALKALIASDFIIKYIPFGFNKREEHYKLIDPFCIFYLRFIHSQKELDSDFWKDNLNSGAVSAWRGYAFENVCFNHISQIKNALGITGVESMEYSWKSITREDKKGAQIDLLIDRMDNVVNLCEMKYSSEPFRIDAAYEEELLHKREAFIRETNNKKTIHLTMISASGLEHNRHSGIIVNRITGEDLFHLS